MRNKLIIIILLVLMIVAYLVFFTPKEKGILYSYSGWKSPSYSHSGERWKTFGGYENGKYIGETRFFDTVTPCYFFPNFLLGFNNLIFSCTVPEGVGTFYSYALCSSYTGEWKDGKKSGQGKSNDICYGKITEGVWKDGNRWNTVTFDTNGNVWGKRLDGEYVFTEEKNEFSNGKYEGEWKDLKWHGEGTFNYPDGRKYKGGWKNWLFNGHGIFTFPDGSNYIGEWKDGEKHGQGSLTFEDGKKIVGQWSDGSPLNCEYFDKDGNAIGNIIRNKNNYPNFQKQLSNTY